MYKKLPSARVLNRFLSYDPETGSLTWKPRPVWMFANAKHGGSREQFADRWNKRYASTPAFTEKTSEGYLRGRFMHRKFVAHRVIWVIQTGSPPAEQIDHINGDKADNRFENLREVSAKQNMRNQVKRVTNSSGITGVHQRKGCKTWYARIRTNEGEINLGSFKTKREAARARKEAELKHGYHALHGTDKLAQ